MTDRLSFRQAFAPSSLRWPSIRGGIPPIGADARWRARLAAVLEGERRQLALWAPAALGLGIWGWFAWPAEPPVWLGVAAAMLALGAAAIALFGPRSGAVRALAAALSVVALGAAAAAHRSAGMAAPVLAVSQTVLVEGRAAMIEPRAPATPGAPARWRITLDRLLFPDGLDGPQPQKIRVSAPAPAEGRAAWLGARLRVSLRLRPPPPPVEPGARDPRRRLWLLGIGAVGAARAPPERVAPPRAEGAGERAWLWLEARRADIAARAIAAAGRGGGGDAVGPVIAALLVGDRSAIDPATAEALRAANLAHLLAISGLHMAIVSLTVFAALRVALALTPGAAAVWDPKKIAAIGALLAATGYLALSGAAVSTERAYAMAVVGFGAVLLDRPAITLRGVAAAAMLLLLWAPESLFSAGFQLSFAATTALVAAFAAAQPMTERLRRRRLANALATLLLAAAVAGLATAPFAAFWFHRLTQYGLIANLAAGPAMGLWVMPWGAAALALSPFGLEGWPIERMAWGVRYILWVAETVAGWPDPIRPVAAAPAWALGAITLGGLWLCLWRALWLRLFGLAPILAAVLGWSAAERPTVLIARDGWTVGVLQADGRAVHRGRGGGYTLERWAAADGADPGAPLDQPSFYRYGGGATAMSAAGWRVEVIYGRRIAPGRHGFRCRPRTLVMWPQADFAAAFQDPPEYLGPFRAMASRHGSCLAIDRAGLAGGPIALWLGPEPRAISAEDQPRRLWTDAATRRRFGVEGGQDQ